MANSLAELRQKALNLFGASRAHDVGEGVGQAGVEITLQASVDHLSSSGADKHQVANAIATRLDQHHAGGFFVGETHHRLPAHNLDAGASITGPRSLGDSYTAS